VQKLREKKMKVIIAVLCSWCIVYEPVFGTPQRTRLRLRQNLQQSPDDVQRAIEEVFNTSPSTPAQNAVRGFAQIVTPEPILSPTTAPQTLITDGEQCTCVPYHMCDPANNTIRGENDVIDGFGLIDIRFDPDDCQEVLDVCCKNGNRKEEPIVPVPVANKPNRASGCGIRNVGGIDFQITGAYDNEAGFGEFPWTVAIIRIDDDACICGGSLIHPKAVLTANHCARDYLNSAKDIKIRAGEWDTQTTKERLPYQERIVSRIFSHPNYNERSLANDVAVIELEDPFQLDDHISTVCLPPSSYVSSSQNCFASGWGKDNFGKIGKYSVIMKKVPLPIVPFNQCQSALQNTRLTDKFRLDPSFICAGGVPGIDTCQGDGGAPLVCPVGFPGDNRYAQSGIVAWGIGCKESHPAVYANVALARDWIDSQVRFIGLDTSYYTY